jgi:PPOX class probable F420-dependent enzyme
MKALTPRNDLEAAGSADLRPGWFDALKGHRYALLSTRRRNGSIARTPVWFAVEQGAVYVRTGATSGKIKRIRNDPRIEIAPCTLRGTPIGEPVDAVARVMTDADWAQPIKLLSRKYPVQLRLYGLLRRKRLAQTVIVQIRPAPAARPLSPPPPPPIR